MSVRRSIPNAVRTVVRERAGRCCEYCQSQERFATSPFVVEHILPHALGGAGVLDNLAYACAGCNGHKAVKSTAIDPWDGKMVPLYHPRRQEWGDHFRWDESATMIEGLTPEGRATVIALQLNRVSLVNLRRVLRLAGEHPPLL